jgi:hypothetical protein
MDKRMKVCDCALLDLAGNFDERTIIPDDTNHIGIGNLNEKVTG